MRDGSKKTRKSKIPAPKTPKTRKNRPENRKNTPKNRKIGKNHPKINPKAEKRAVKKCRPFSFYTANCEQTVNERNFQIFTEKTEKCEKMKIIFTFPLGRSCSHKIFKIFNGTLVCTKKSKNLPKCVDKRVFLC